MHTVADTLCLLQDPTLHINHVVFFERKGPDETESSQSLILAATDSQLLCYKIREIPETCVDLVCSIDLKHVSQLLLVHNSCFVLAKSKLYTFNTSSLDIEQIPNLKGIYCLSHYTHQILALTTKTHVSLFSLQFEKLMVKSTKLKLGIRKCRKVASHMVY
jgi:hypothetical protein